MIEEFNKILVSYMKKNYDKILLSWKYCPRLFKDGLVVEYKNLNRVELELVSWDDLQNYDIEESLFIDGKSC